MKNLAKFKLYQVGVGSNIAQNHSSNLSGVMFSFNSNEKLPKVSLCLVGIGCKLGQGPID